MKKLICILLLLCLCLSLAACGGGTKGGTTPTNAPSGGGNPTKAPSGGSQPSGGNEQPAEDPMASTLVIGAKADFTGEGKNLIYDMLLFRIDSYSASDYVVSSTHNDDYTEFTLKVTPGVKFTDGTALTADMVKFSIESQLNTAPNGFAGLIDSLDVKDDSTLVMKLTAPYMNTEYDLTYFYCVKPGEVSDDGNFVEWVGTGPYILTEHQQDVRAEFTRNEDYWNPAKKGAPKTIIWKVLPDETTRVMALEKKEVDVLGVDSHAASGLSNSTLSEIQKKGELTIMMRSGSNPATYMYNYVEGPMSDIELRKAVTYAIDRQGMVDVAALGFGHAMGTFLGPDDKYSNRNGEEYTYDPEMSKKILADAGYVDTNGNGIVEKNGDGKDIVLQFVTMSSDTYRTIGVLFAEYLKAVGIGCEISSLETSAFLERTNAGDIDICMCHPWTTAIAYFTMRGSTSDYDNFGPGFGVNDKFPGYLQTILTSTSEEEIQETFDKVWADIYAAYPATPLYAGISTYVHTDEVSGFIWTRGTQNLLDFSEVVINRK
jgi:ABC-type transport system substrate-binding protein